MSFSGPRFFFFFFFSFFPVFPFLFSFFFWGGGGGQGRQAAKEKAIRVGDRRTFLFDFSRMARNH